jgi:transposase
VAVPPDRDPDPVRVFSTFTEDLEKMAQWLVDCGVATVAMESTAVYGFRSTTWLRNTG